MSSEESGMLKHQGRLYMPRTEPHGWRQKRAARAWGAFAAAVGVSVSLQWLAQVIGGGIVGSLVGAEGIANITPSDRYYLHEAALWSTIIITAIVAIYVVILVREDLTWAENRAGQRYAVEWWTSLWRPILIGVAVHGVLFSMMMYGWAAV